MRTHPVQRFPYLISYLEQADDLDVLHAYRDIPASLQDVETHT